MKSFYVLSWDFNSDSLEKYDIIPYLIREYEELDPEEKPDTFNKVKDFITAASRYRFWSRCEYEIVITGWPKHKNEIKIDIHSQIMNNIDIITSLFIEIISDKYGIDKAKF